AGSGKREEGIALNLPGFQNLEAFCPALIRHIATPFSLLRTPWVIILKKHNGNILLVAKKVFIRSVDLEFIAGSYCANEKIDVRALDAILPAYIEKYSR